MAYTITLTNGTTFATVADGTINTDSSMTLVGKNYAGYGEFLNENVIHLLESGSNSTAPSSPLRGQLWYDAGSASQPNSLKVYTGTKFQRLAAITASTTTPSTNQQGDLWWDTTNDQLKAYDGASFVTIGPVAASGLGNTGAIPTSITDTLGNTHVVIENIVNGDTVSIVSPDAQFTPNPSITGFTSIQPGITLANSVGGESQFFQGTATNSLQLGGANASSYLSSIANDTTTGTLGILNDSGLSVGVDSDLRLTVDTSTSVANVYNQTANANVNIQVNRATVKTTAVAVDGTTGTIGVLGITNLGANASGNIGSATGYFNRVFATSTSALYADVAERYAADAVYEPGTLVELGGEQEITLCVDPNSERVFGVISEHPAYLLNAGAGGDDTHPPVALMGRVGVKVQGQGQAGDRLVCAGNGVAEVADKDASSWMIIGRLLNSKDTNDIEIVEAVVTTR